MGTAVASTVDPYFVNNRLTSNEMRYALSALVGRDPTSPVLAETGVLPGGGIPFGLSSNGTASAPQVSVAPGHCVVATAAGGTYVCTWPVAANVTLTTPAGNPRIDVLCARVRDTDVDASGVKVFELLTVDGTPAASPTVPAIPAGYLPLYQITVASSGAGGGLTMTDVRPFTRAAGGVRVVTASQLVRAGSYTGDLRVQGNGQVDVWLGSSWVTVASPAVWSQFTPTLQTSGNAGGVPVGANGSAIGRYLVVGKVCHLRYVFRVGAGAPAAGWGDISTQLPPGITSAPAEETQILAKLNAHWPVGTLYAIFLGKCFITSSSTTMALYFPVDINRSDLHTYQMSADSNGTAGTGYPRVPSGYPAPGVLVIQGTIEIQ